MILWLASYPKSGNTLLRSFLSTYFFSKDGIFNFDLLENIKQYPQPAFFYNLGININDKHEVAKSHIQAQQAINKRGKNFKFLKTHSGFVKMDGFSFTDLNNSLGVIYIVRDPRDIVLSFSHHNNETIEETSKKINGNYILDGDIKKTLMIGDSETDANAAKSAGIPVILLEDGYTEKNITEIYHNHLVKDFVGIEKIVSKYL